MNQAELIEKPLSPDVYTLLRLFENCHGIDHPQTFDDLKQHYHSVYDDPKALPKISWSRARLSKALDAAEADGLVEYREHWEITAKGLEARKAEYERRMRG